MTVVIKKETTKKEIKNLLLKFNMSNKNKGLRQFYGKFPIDGDALVIQKKLRNEWN